MISAPPQSPNYVQGFARQRGGSAYPALSDGLVGLWAPFLGPTGETLFDWSACKNDGTLTNMAPATDWVVTRSGAALKFGGTNEHVLLQRPPFVSYPHTMVSLLETGAAGESTFGLAVANGGSPSNFWAIEANVGNFFVYYFRAGGTEWIIWGAPAANQVYMIAGVSRASDHHELWVDGQLRATSSTDATPSSVDKASIGAALDSSPSYGKGRVIATMAWDRALVASELQTLCADPYALLRLRRRALSVLAAIGGPYLITAGQVFHTGGTKGDLFSSGSIVGECHGRSG